MYDKECQGPDYVDFKKPEKKKRAHHRREPEPVAHDTKEMKEEAKPHDEFQSASEHGTSTSGRDEKTSTTDKANRSAVPGGAWDDHYLQ